MSRPLPSPEEDYINATWTKLNKRLKRRGIQPIVLAGGQNYLFAKVSTGLSLHVLPTDGTNTMPMMDDTSRPGYQIVTDGTYDWNFEKDDNEITPGSSTQYYPPVLTLGYFTDVDDFIWRRGGLKKSDGSDIANNKRGQLVVNLNYVWDAGNTKWVPMTQP